MNIENTPCFGSGSNLVSFVVYKRQLLVGSNPPCRVGLILKCAFIVGGEVAVAVWTLAGWAAVDLVAETPKDVLLSSRCNYHRFFF